MIYSSPRSFTLKLVTVFIILLCQLQQINGYKLLNCYSSLPSSFYKDNTNEFQSSSLCHTTCSGKGHNYFALANHSDCYCGDSSPSGLSTSSSCNANCYGYGQEMCGGTSSFSIYTENDSETVNDDNSNSDTTTSNTNNNNNNAAAATSTKSPTKASKPTASALGVGATGSQILVGTAQTTSSVDTGASTVVSEQDVVATSVVYSTQLQTQGGSTIFVTNTITKSTQAMPTGNGTNTNDRTGANHKKKKVNVGAIVGGVVGGVCGAIVIAVIVLLGLRHYNMKREEDRMEKEYQEAIKPVEYVPNDILSSSSHSYSFDGGNMNSKMGHDMNVVNDSIGMTTLPINNMMDSNSNNSNNNISNNSIGNNNNFNNNYNIPHSNSNNNNNMNNLTVANPFDDSRRISTGSIMTEDTDPNKPAKLTIVNPDE